MREVPDGIARRLTHAADSFAPSFEHLRMEDIAQSSGIPRATLYYYFSGKDDILGFLFTSLLAEIRAGLATAADSPGSTRERLTALIRVLLARLAARPAAAQLLLTNLGRAGKLPDMAAAIRAAAYEPFGRVLAEGMARGDLRTRDVELTSTALFGSVCIVGLQTLVTEGGLDAQTLAVRLCDIFWHGVSVGTPPTGKRTS